MSATDRAPEVYFLATSIPRIGSILAYLEDIGAQGWNFDQGQYRPDDPEKLVEFAGRLCYKSWGVGLNPNITKTRNDPTAYIANIIKSGHGSVLEHVHFSIVFRNVTRVFTHELVRHRHGNFSQESMRYVRLDDLEYYYPQIFLSLLPPSLRNTPEDDERRIAFPAYMMDWFGEKMAILSDWQVQLADIWEIDQMDFHEKKLLTSAFRRLAPEGVSTQILWTTNLRELRHVIAQRTDLGAEEEIRRVFDKVATAAKIRYPKSFADFSSRLDPQDPLQIPIWEPSYHDKV